MVMDGIIRPSVPNGGGGGGDVAAVDDDLGDGMQCTDHPYRNNTPGGICAFCLQEKLGKLVSASSSFFIGSSSSSSPSFRSDVGSATSKSVTGFGGRNGSTTTNFGVAASTTTGTTSTLSLSIRPAVAAATSSIHENDGYESRRARLPFLLAQKKKKKLIPPPSSATTTNDSYHHRPSNNLVLKRSKSTATPRRGGNSSSSEGEDFSPHAKRSFWSFLHLSKHSSATSTAAARRSDKITPRDLKSTSTPKRTSTIFVGAADNAPAVSAPSSTSAGIGSLSSAATKRVECTVIDEADSPNSSSSNATSFGRKVSRSRSVGCGSRSFSGDFFERISTGFGDCTLRRVESQREGKRSSSSGNVRGGVGRDAIEERVRCGGIFSGFMLASSSSYWVSGSEDQANGKVSGGGAGLGAVVGGRSLVHGRSKSSGWAFASPMRAFGSSNRPSGNKNDGGVGGNKNANPTPNLAAIPSLLAVR